MTNIKIVYQTTPEENTIPWKNHFSDIIDCMLLLSEISAEKGQKAP